MAARSVAEINSILVYKSPPGRAGLFTLVSMVSGFSATMGVAEAHIPLKRRADQWQMTEGVHWERWDWPL